MLFLPVEYIKIDAFFIRDIVVHEKLTDLLFEPCRVQSLSVVCVVEGCQVDPLHFLPIVGKGQLYPVNDAFEVNPKLISVRIVLMDCHVAVNIA